MYKNPHKSDAYIRIEKIWVFVCIQKTELFIKNLLPRKPRPSWLFPWIPQTINGWNNTNLPYGIPESKKKKKSFFLEHRNF